MLSKCKNSWVLSVKNKINTKYNHHFFCNCSKKFKLQTKIEEPDAPEILCPICGNDYFKDAVAFKEMTSTKIWKYFQWISLAHENETYWNISLQYEIPIYNNKTHEVNMENKELLHINLKKDGTFPFRISYESKILSKYSLFLDDKVQSFKKLLLNEAKENLYNYIIMNRNNAIDWINTKELKRFSLNERLQYLTFFLKNPHLKEHKFFFWKMDRLHNHTIKYTTQIEMLNFIANNRKEKSIKKAFYQGYINSINHTGYYPYSDYIFSRSIQNIDLLIKLYAIHPTIKQHIFTDDTFTVAIEFILFLKKYYTEKQIVKLFTKEMQDIKEYNNKLTYWRDTLHMLQTINAFNSLEEHFSKVKLSLKKLHDEIVRIFHIVSYKLDAKENFEYDELYLSACGNYGDLNFKLPSTVKELSLWAKTLHNCMFSYSRRIHQKQSIIYGLFKAEELLYAIELNNLKIVQAKAIFNKNISDYDMKSINSWKDDRIKFNEKNI